MRTRVAIMYCSTVIWKKRVRRRYLRRMRVRAEFRIVAQPVEQSGDARRDDAGRLEAGREQLRLEHETRVGPRVAEPHAAEHAAQCARQRRRGRSRRAASAAGGEHVAASGQAHLAALEREPVPKQHSYIVPYKYKYK